MSKEGYRKLWHQPWSYREGTIIIITILLIGFGLQFFSGGVVLRVAGFPWNLISGVIFLVLLVLSFFLWKKHPLIKGLSSVKVALPAILGFTFLVLLMGFVKQDVPAKNFLSRIFGLTHLIKTWPFILVNIYILILLGIITLKRLKPFNLKNAGFFLNHFGLFLVLFSTALGSSDMQRVTMNCYETRTGNRATDESGKVTELPFSIRLLNFKIDEFRPKIVLVDNQTGQAVQHKGKAEFQLLDRDSFKLSDYQVKVAQFLDFSEKLGDSYLASEQTGSVTSAKLIVSNLADHSEISGWICCGNSSWQPQVLKLDKEYSVVMLPPEPRKFSSEIEILSQEGKLVGTTIEVNKPFHFGGWTIYQLSYDTGMGRWSDLSVLQLVRDPWLPLVYVGIFMMMAGAGFLFIFGKPKNGETEHVA